MDILVIILALAFLIGMAYRGHSVIILAPVVALLAVALTDVRLILPYFSTIFMEKMVDFIRLFFPVFLLGAIFGKLISVSGFAGVIASSMLRLFGIRHAIEAIVVVGAVLTYGGVSLFVVAFSLYPFAAQLFRAADIPKRLIPATIALGAFTFTMDALPGSPQIQNIIPTAFFHTDTWAAPWLGLCGGLFIFLLGIAYLQARKRRALARGEGYGTGHSNEPAAFDDGGRPSLFAAVLPLMLVAGFNKLFTGLIPRYYDNPKQTAAWAVEMALVIGIMAVLIFAWRRIRIGMKAELQISINGALLATMNTASEYGFGGVIAVLPGFAAIRKGIGAAFQHILLNEAVTVTVLSGITGSSSGGMSIALASMSGIFIDGAAKAGVSTEVLHRVASMASGGMDTLPHNGAIITLFVITGMTHRTAYKDIFALTLLKVAGAFFIILLYHLFGIV